jgi:hypothetical protein
MPRPDVQQGFGSPPHRATAEDDAEALAVVEEYANQPDPESEHQNSPDNAVGLEAHT